MELILEVKQNKKNKQLYVYIPKISGFGPGDKIKVEPTNKQLKNETV